MPNSVSVAVDKESEAPKGKSPTEWGKYWADEYQAAQKRVRVYQKRGNEIVKRYKDERDDANADSLYTAGFRGTQPFRLNLFYTNITTLQSMLFGSTPKIEVTREHHDPDDDVARVACLMYQRILEADAYASGEDLSTTLKQALQDRLLPGMGINRVRYSATMKEVKQLDPETLEPVDVEVLDYESVKCEYVHWQDFLWGWARSWEEVPWMGFRVWLTNEEATKRFGKKKADSLEYKKQQPTGTENKDNTYQTDQKDNTEKAEIWEMWHKEKRKVFWWSYGVDEILDSEDDPLQLDGFWPAPRPMIANLTTTLFMPTADFILAQDLYNEIDELQSRIGTITRAVKVVGVYDKNAGDSIGRMFKEGVENDMIPVDNWAMFAEKGGLKGSIDWFPVQDVVQTLDTLISIRAQTIELLYQVTGMSDILRGANTDQYTSDGTNQLKAKFGSIRVQALQDDFARYASELDELKAEVVSKHFETNTIIQQSNAAFLPEADKPLVPEALQLMQSSQIKWRVNIRPESLAMVDYAQLKSERTEFLTAMATYIQSAQAAVQQIPGSLPILLEMLKWGMAGFKGANYLEGTMDQAIEMAKKAPPEQSQKDAEAQKQQAEMQKAQMQAQIDMQKIQAKAQADMRILQAKMQAELSVKQYDTDAKRQQAVADHEADMQRIAADLQADLDTISAKLQADLAVEDAQSTMAIAEREVDHLYTATENEQEHENALEQSRQTVQSRQNDE
jgi:hypothetical protein